MARNKLFTLQGLIGLATILGSIGVGELFINGTFLSGLILGIFPGGVHTIVGWLIIIGGLLAGLKAIGLMKR